METVKSIQNQGNDWGYIEVDANGKLISASPDFCYQFAVKQPDLIGIPIVQVIQSPSLNAFLYRSFQNKVFFGTIFGYSCLIRVFRKIDSLIFRVLVRQEEVDYSEMISFVNTLDKPKIKKKSGHNNRYSFEDIIGNSPAISQIKELAAKIAMSNSTVLLTGESGTGKELFAQAIHDLSSRRNQPFVAVNCAAIPEELFESEVFGYEAGAFSGAKKEGKPGKIELAQNGTLFLDEISELPYQAQGKLLRVLQEREVERLGGTGSKNIDIRIVAATNRDLKMLVKKGNFRQDLFYRLFVFELKIPSLKQRREDILPLAYYFIDYFNEKLRHNVKYIEPALQEWLLRHDWPGNVRELRAYIERGMNIVEGHTLTIDCLYVSPLQNMEEEMIDTTDDSFLSSSLAEVVAKAEISAIQRALKECDGDRTLAAHKLKIHLSSLYRKITMYKLK